MFLHSCFRLLKHFSKLVDAIHILCGTRISRVELIHAKQLLKEFVIEFEQVYKKKNMVFNIHLLLHLADSVQKNGPLYCYSNYGMEDNMGHLLAFVNGTNDVILQISEKYLMERNLIHNLRNSPKAKQYYDTIQASQRYLISEKFERSYVVGKLRSELNSEEMGYIVDSLDLLPDYVILEYKAILLHGETYYETIEAAKGKRTNDSFVCIPEDDVYGEIHTFFTVNGQLYIFFYNKYNPVYTPLSSTGTSIIYFSCC